MKIPDLQHYLGKRFKNKKTGFVGIAVGYTVDNCLLIRMDKQYEIVPLKNCVEV